MLLVMFSQPFTGSDRKARNPALTADDFTQLLFIFRRMKKLRIAHTDNAAARQFVALASIFR